MAVLERLFAVLIALFVLAAGPAAGAGEPVSWDLSHQERALQSRFSGSVSLLESSGFDVETGFQDLPEALESARIVVIPAPQSWVSSYTEREADALERFLRNPCHGAIILSENSIEGLGCWDCNLKLLPLMSRFGIVPIRGEHVSGSVAVPEGSSDPLFAGVRQIDFNEAGPLQVAPDAETILRTPEGRAVVAGKFARRLMVVGDSNFVTDSPGGQSEANRRFLLNLFQIVSDAVRCPERLPLISD